MGTKDKNRSPTRTVGHACVTVIYTDWETGAERRTGGVQNHGSLVVSSIRHLSHVIYTDSKPVWEGAGVQGRVEGRAAHTLGGSIKGNPGGKIGLVAPGKNLTGGGACMRAGENVQSRQAGVINRVGRESG
jgi:hypothetical protein